MRYKDMRDGMILKCIADYADCIHIHREYKVFESAGYLHITCDAGSHDLFSTCTEEGDLPEFIEKSS